MRTHLAILIILTAATTVACTGTSRELSCIDDTVCLRDGVQGSCLTPGFCAFDDGDCTSGMRWDTTAGDGLADDCVSAGGDPPDAGPGFENTCGGTMTLQAEPGTDCGVCDSGTWQCSGTESVACTGELSISRTIAFEGSVVASTEFSGSFEAELSVDGDLSSSWFSSGPENNGVPSIYTWTGTRDDCFESISISGNAQHSNSSFRTDFGFGQATILILDASDDPVFSETVQLPGTPDPDRIVMPGVMGRKVQIEFLGHESDDCGGFSELIINALR
jgi:hypothetical protein